VIDSEIRTTPISIRPVVAVEIVFSDHGKFGIERYTDTGISRQLERSSIVECPHHYRSAGLEPHHRDVPGLSFLVTIAY
jgi:hypothetical protein